MELPPKAIEELKNLYRKHQCIELCDQDAKEIAETVLKLFALVYKPIPKRLLECTSSKYFRPFGLKYKIHFLVKDAIFV